MVISFGNILKQITTRSLLAHPISFCMVGLIFSVMLSHLSHMQIRLALQSTDSFLRICAFYFLLVATIDSCEKMRRYLASLGVLIAILAALALLEYHGVINIPELEACHQREVDTESGDVNYVERLCGSGIFNDPNDLSLILVLGVLTSIYLSGHILLDHERLILPLASSDLPLLIGLNTFTRRTSDVDRWTAELFRLPIWSKAGNSDICCLCPAGGVFLVRTTN